ncbi:MAG: hypothetical protein R3F42_11085 [Pseudomonadota bacterium]
MTSAAYQQLATRIDALQLRERILLLIACLVVLFYCVDSFGLQPLSRQQLQLRQDIADLETRLETLRARAGLLGGNDALTAARKAELQAELDTLGRQLQSQLGSMLAPEQAAGILEQVLTRESDLTLQSVSAWSEPLTAPDPSTGEAVTVPGIARYELQLELEGGYLATLHYLRALEALPWKFFWQGIAFEITEHPQARVTLNLYTLELLEG